MKVAGYKILHWLDPGLSPTCSVQLWVVGFIRATTHYDLHIHSHDYRLGLVDYTCILLYLDIVGQIGPAHTQKLS